jgi:peptidoglycan/LPS O-acetylase OafA/YrhL
MTSSIHPVNAEASLAPADTISKREPGGRLAFLDMLRGVAALAVVLAHSFTMSAMPYNPIEVFDLGYFGVHLFFLCSGFIIPVSLQNSQSLKRFWLRRVFRLYPLYWLNIVCWLVVVYGLKLGRFQGATFASEPVGSVAANATMLQQLLGFDHLVPLYWTLSLEMLFYIVVSLLFVFRLLPHGIGLAWAFISAGVIVEGVLPLLVGAQSPRILSYLAVMFTGKVWHDFSRGQIEPKAAWRTLLGAMLMSGVLALNIDPASGTLSIHSQGLFGQIGAYALFVFAFHRRDRPSPAILLFMGLISYSLYLMHLVIITVVPKTSLPLVTMLVWVALTVAVSSLTYALIEKPAIRLGHALSRRTS